MYQSRSKKWMAAMLFMISLTACSADIRPSTPDEILDAIDGMSNHANEPD